MTTARRTAMADRARLGGQAGEFPRMCKSLTGG
jgi:hypothetical protein